MCGAYAEAQAKGLARGCPSIMALKHQGTLRQLNELLRGIHPRTKLPSLPPPEVSDPQHDGNHEDRCKEIWICATETGRGDQEACGTEGTKKKKVRSVQNICCSLFRALSCLSDLKLF